MISCLEIAQCRMLTLYLIQSLESAAGMEDDRPMRVDIGWYRSVDLQCLRKTKVGACRYVETGSLEG